MDIARVLKKSWPSDLRESPPRGEQSDEALCGSMASHFEISKTGRLSFFEVGAVTAERAALAIAFSRKEVDEVDYITVSKDIVADLGITFEKNPGQTPLDDVNQSHVDGCNITLRRLSRLVLVTAQLSSFYSLSSKAVVEQLCLLSDAGQPPKVHKDLLAKVKQTRVYKRIVQERSRQGLPPPLGA